MLLHHLNGIAILVNDHRWSLAVLRLAAISTLWRHALRVRHLKRTKTVNRDHSEAKTTKPWLQLLRRLRRDIAMKLASVSVAPNPCNAKKMAREPKHVRTGT